MKKIFSLLLLLITAYGIALFLKPTITDGIEKVLGFEGFGNNVRSQLGFINKTVTDIPSLGEIQSGALDIKNKVSGGIKTTKDTIDSVRSTLSGAEDTYNKALGVFDETTETIEKFKGTLNDVEKLGKSIKGTVNTDVVQ